MPNFEAAINSWYSEVGGVGGCCCCSAHLMMPSVPRVSQVRQSVLCLLWCILAAHAPLLVCALQRIGFASRLLNSRMLTGVVVIVLAAMSQPPQQVSKYHGQANCYNDATAHFSQVSASCPAAVCCRSAAVFVFTTAALRLMLEVSLCAHPCNCTAARKLCAGHACMVHYMLATG